MARIDELTFGCVVLEGKKCHRDILVLADGMKNRRKGGLLMFSAMKSKGESLKN